MAQTREVTIHEITASGHEAVLLASSLLQRARLADPRAGVWEAADVQWWSRRLEEPVEQHFWLDDDGPVAAVYLSYWKGAWQCDPLLVPGRCEPILDVVWERVLSEAARRAPATVEVPVPGHDPQLRALAEASGLVPGDSSCSSWLDLRERTAASAELPDAFQLVDRTQRRDRPHPMLPRNGDHVEERLRATPLYDPALDLSIETADGRPAGYTLCWFDPDTRVGLIEPVRVEEEFWRRGLARAMLTAGLDRFTVLGAERAKIGWESDAAGSLYQSLGFQKTSTDVWYRVP